MADRPLIRLHNWRPVEGASGFKCGGGTLTTSRFTCLAAPEASPPKLRRASLAKILAGVQLGEAAHQEGIEIGLEQGLEFGVNEGGHGPIFRLAGALHHAARAASLEGRLGFPPPGIDSRARSDVAPATDARRDPQL